jgi:hypothetical protein
MRLAPRVAFHRAVLLSVLCAGLTVTAGCTARTVVETAPSPAPRMSEIADGSAVRLRHADTVWIEGRASAFSGIRPAIVTASGETVAVTCADELQVRDPIIPHRGTAGAISGLLIAGVAVSIGCAGQRYCGEENPLPALAAIAGYFVGRSFRTVRYLPLDRIECAARGATMGFPDARAREHART